ncbi:hypothetical protein F5887DRAFT_921058 [Amanita rubescens]|nr:hypothetical protein F5887DRAFT_921058 [Amanita rubescens]
MTKIVKFLTVTAHWSNSSRKWSNQCSTASPNHLVDVPDEEPCRFDDSSASHQLSVCREEIVGIDTVVEELSKPSEVANALDGRISLDAGRWDSFDSSRANETRAGGDAIQAQISDSGGGVWSAVCVLMVAAVIVNMENFLEDEVLHMLNEETKDLQQRTSNVLTTEGAQSIAFDAEAYPDDANEDPGGLLIEDTPFAWIEDVECNICILAVVKMGLIVRRRGSFFSLKFSANNDHFQIRPFFNTFGSLQIDGWDVTGNVFNVVHVWYLARVKFGQEIAGLHVLDFIHSLSPGSPESSESSSNRAALPSASLDLDLDLSELVEPEWVRKLSGDYSTTRDREGQRIKGRSDVNVGILIQVVGGEHGCYVEFSGRVTLILIQVVGGEHGC